MGSLGISFGRERNLLGKEQKSTTRDPNAPLAQ